MKSIEKQKCSFCNGEKYIIITKKVNNTYDLFIQCPCCSDGQMNVIKENNSE